MSCVRVRGVLPPSLPLPGLTEQRAQHAAVVVAECAELRETAQQTGEVLGILGVSELGELVQELQQRLLQSLHLLPALQERAV